MVSYPKWNVDLEHVYAQINFCNLMENVLDIVWKNNNFLFSFYFTKISKNIHILLIVYKENSHNFGLFILGDLNEDCDGSEKVCKHPLGCINKKCKCKENYEEFGITCRIKESKKRALGESCLNSMECVKGWFSNINKLIIKKIKFAFFLNCILDGLTNATCTDDICRCNDFYTTVDNKCVAQSYGDPCENGIDDEKCRFSSYFPDKNSRCNPKSKKCDCKDGFEWQREMCLKIGCKFIEEKQEFIWFLKKWIF